VKPMIRLLVGLVCGTVRGPFAPPWNKPEVWWEMTWWKWLVWFLLALPLLPVFLPLALLERRRGGFDRGPLSERPAEREELAKKIREIQARQHGRH